MNHDSDKRFFFLVALAIVLLTSSTVQAQLTTASMNGTVSDKTGQPLVGATIRVVHEPTGTQYGTSTREDGRFNLQGLRVGGPYSIKVSFVGYKYQERSNINLELSQNLRMDFTLIEEAVQVGEVQIIGERNALLSAGRTGATTSVSRQQIDQLPTIGRSFQDFQRLSPLFVGNNAAGRNNRFNNIQLDGAVYNDLFGLAASGTPGGQAGTTPIGLDAVQEFQVVVAPFDVRYGGFTGGGINAITRSGSNKLSGSAFYYGRNQSFVGTLYDTLKYPNFSEYQTGVRISGPIIENQLFYFVNGEITQRNQPLSRTFGAPALVTGLNQFNVAPDTINNFLAILDTLYHYNPGSIQSMTNQTVSGKIFAKLDLNISEDHHLTLRHNYVNGWNHNQPSNAGIYPENSRYQFIDNTNSTVLQLRSTFSNTLANELILGYTTIKDHREYPGSAFPFVTIRNGGVVPNSSSTSLNLVAGTENFSVANALDQNILEFTDNVSYYMGEHTFTFGTQNQFFSFSNLFIRDQLGNYEFANLSDFALGKAVRYQYSYSLHADDPNFRAKFNVNQLGFYAQDEWAVLPQFKLTFGVRADIPMFPTKPAFNANIDTITAAGQWIYGSGYETNIVPSTQLLLSPRVGFNWDVAGDRTTQVRGGTGIFTGRVGYVWISNQYGNTGVDFGRLDVSSAFPAGFFQPNPYNQPQPGAPGLSPVKTTEVDLTDPNFKMPQVLRFDLAVDQQLPHGFVGTIEGLYTKSINDILYQDVNLVGPSAPAIAADTNTHGALAVDGRPIFGTYSYSSTSTGKGGFSVVKISPKFTNVILMKNTNQGDAYNLTLQLQHPMGADGWYFNTAYTLGSSRDLNSVQSSQAVSQWRYNHTPGDPNNPPLAPSAFDVRHRVFVAVSYRADFVEDFPTTFSLFYDANSGTPFSYIVNGDLNGDGQNQNDLVYIPRDRNDITLVSSTGARLSKNDNAYDVLEQYIANDSYLNSHRGQIADRMSSRTPWNHQLDARIVQEIPVIPGHRVEITLDILNVLNLLNSNSGKIYSVSNQAYNLMSFFGLDPLTKRPLYTMANTYSTPWSPIDLLSRWQMQLGVRYTF